MSSLVSKGGLGFAHAYLLCIPNRGLVYNYIGDVVSLARPSREERGSGIVDLF